MLSIFPDLLTFGLIAPFIIRVTLGAYFVYGALTLISTDARRQTHSPFLWGVFILPAIIGGMLVLTGFYTQIGALILMARLAFDIYRAPTTRTVSIFAFIMALSLLFSGAGFFAFDLPL
ncbi:MAG: hypothetical protein A3D67_02385 [Candidatus Lloydbacteria bacterium RIFCSPHIGHO2_02_FULL_51_22]|uniref:Uncharacterized protein n=2 Tax=Candidatus Lloydiibacteriota TaxID=1817910 RepID=A0A1G2DEZ2_9BACT|nr:MAG: hypothetical protein A3D67_02385 [Candidatus Lloydbacteria bacterium RIFCSPHIGHO2_02_FULL_51_22]OGZ17291.1 MAG: hypothetical protein A3G11_01825 [Candidatus Lloydbacteria bacterium RIFCSPLOWO2_12_FULL_51_9]